MCFLKYLVTGIIVILVFLSPHQMTANTFIEFSPSVSIQPFSFSFNPGIVQITKQTQEIIQNTSISKIQGITIPHQLIILGSQITISDQNGNWSLYIDKELDQDPSIFSEGAALTIKNTENRPIYTNEQIVLETFLTNKMLLTYTISDMNENIIWRHNMLPEISKPSRFLLFLEPTEKLPQGSYSVTLEYFLNGNQFFSRDYLQIQSKETTEKDIEFKAEYILATLLSCIGITLFFGWILKRN